MFLKSLMSCATSEPRPLYRLGISVQGAPCWQTELFRLNDDITISGTHVGVTRARQVFPGRDKPDTHGAMILMIEVAATAEGLLPPGNSTVIELGEISPAARAPEVGTQIYMNKEKNHPSCIVLDCISSGAGKDRIMRLEVLPVRIIIKTDPRITC